MTNESKICFIPGEKKSAFERVLTFLIIVYDAIGFISSEHSSLRSGIVDLYKINTFSSNIFITYL